MSEPVFSLRLLATRMRWLEKRTSLIAGNIANVNTPEFKPSDLNEKKFARHVENLKKSDRKAAAPQSSPKAFPLNSGSANSAFEINKESENVSIDKEMLRLTETQIQYQTMTTLYRHQLSLLRKAIGK